MQKIVVLDTSVLIHDPNALEKFDDHHLVIPMTVIEKLDGLRKGHGLISLAAHEALRKIDEFHGNGVCSHESASADDGKLKILGENGEFAGLSPDDKIVKSAIMRAAEGRGNSCSAHIKRHRIANKSRSLWD